MKTALSLLVRCRELREQAAQRAQAHAAHHVQLAQRDEGHRRAAAAAESTRQHGEQAAMLHRLLQHEVLPQVMAGLLEHHGQRRDVHGLRIDKAVQRCRHMQQHLEYARRCSVHRTRALERAGQLVEGLATQERVQAECAHEALDDDYIGAWVHRRHSTAVA